MSALPHQHDPIRVLLADTHFTALWGLARLIRSEPTWFDLVDLASSPYEALASAELHHPHIVLLDNSLDVDDALDLVPKIQATGTVRVIMLAASVSTALRERTRMAGAYGLLNKAAAAEHLLSAIDLVHRFGCWVDLGADGNLPAIKPHSVAPAP